VFIELMPLLAGRTVMITVARVDDRTLRVNVIPTKTVENENAALTTPLSYTGTPEELDGELGKQVAGYVEAHQQLGSTLAQHALALLARLFRYGTMSYYGGFINLATGGCAPLPTDSRLWRRVSVRRRGETKSRNAITGRAA